jgi:hypothetical protein
MKIPNYCNPKKNLMNDKENPPGNDSLHLMADEEDCSTLGSS